MKLESIVFRKAPLPDTEGGKIPWNEPGFSERMLNEHLSQAHDLASRRARIIDQHVDWIHQVILEGRPSKVLDLGCGPGLYSSRLAQAGHRCTGIDFSPASIKYAREQAQARELACTYLEGDVRITPFGEGYDLAMMIYGEFNTFIPTDGQVILEKAFAAMRPGGKLLLEMSRPEAVKRYGKEGPGWHSSSKGLFSPEPHIVLTEAYWLEQLLAAVTRFYVIQAETGTVESYLSTTYAYAEDLVHGWLYRIGFSDVRSMTSLRGLENDPDQPDLFVISASRP